MSPVEDPANHSRRHLHHLGVTRTISYIRNIRHSGKIRTTAAALGLAGVMFTMIGTQAASASTAPAAGSGAAIAEQVLDAANPVAAYNALTDAQKAAYGSAEEPVSVTAQVANVSPAVAGCWDAYVLYDWKAAAGNTVYTTWQGLNWCANGSITKWHVYVRGGETSTPGWSYEGNDGQGARNVGWEVRQYTQQKFTFGIGQYGYSTSPCTQIRGGHTGLYATQASCNLG